MKIISKGNELAFKKEVKCTNCDSVLEIEGADIKYGKFYSGMDAEVSFDYYVICVVCGEKIFLKEKDIPEGVKWGARSNFKDKKK